MSFLFLPPFPFDKPPFRDSFIACSIPIKKEVDLLSNSQLKDFLEGHYESMASLLQVPVEEVKRHYAPQNSTPGKLQAYSVLSICFACEGQPHSSATFLQ